MFFPQKIGALNENNMALREQIDFLQLEKVCNLKLDLEKLSLFLQNHVRPGKN